MTTTAGSAKLVVAANDRDHIKGPARAPVTLVEYGDYECVQCAQFHQVSSQLEQRMPRRFRLVYRHFPLGAIHPHARLAAEAVEAAGAQGKFWQMHTLLFEHQLVLSSSTIFGLAARLQLDMARFTQELNQHLYGDKVWTDLMGGVRSGVNGTPTLFFNGLRHDGPQDPVTLMQVLEHACQPAARSVALGGKAS